MDIGENLRWKIKKRRMGNWGKEKSDKWEITMKGYRETRYWKKEKLGKRIICKITKWKKRN